MELGVKNQSSIHKNKGAAQLYRPPIVRFYGLTFGGHLRAAPFYIIHYLSFHHWMQSLFCTSQRISSSYVLMYRFLHYHDPHR